MQVISSDELVSDFPRLLASVEAGEEVVIARGQEPIAKLIPFGAKLGAIRPKVGQMISPAFEVPDAAWAPLGLDELNYWGL